MPEGFLITPERRVWFFASGDVYIVGPEAKWTPAAKEAVWEATKMFFNHFWSPS